MSFNQKNVGLVWVLTVFSNQRMKCVVCLKGMKDEDLTQLTRFIPLLKWSTVLFPNGISVLQDSKYTQLFF